MSGSAGCDSNVSPDDPSSSLGEIIALPPRNAVEYQTKRESSPDSALFPFRLEPDVPRRREELDRTIRHGRLKICRLRPNNPYAARLFPLLPVPPLLFRVSRSDFTADSFRCHVAARGERTRRGRANS